MKVKTCTLQDIASLVELAREFIEESRWGFTFDEQVCKLSFFDFIQGTQSCVLMIENDKEIMGAAILVAAQDLTIEKQGFIHKFYISPKHRRTRAAFLLTDACNKWFDEQGTAVDFTTSTGAVEGSICGYAKLMGKYGYVSCGPTLSRIKNE